MENWTVNYFRSNSLVIQIEFDLVFAFAMLRRAFVAFFSLLLVNDERERCVVVSCVYTVYVHLEFNFDVSCERKIIIINHVSLISLRCSFSLVSHRIDNCRR